MASWSFWRPLDPHPVAVRTAADLSPQFRDEVSATARVLYDAA